LRHSAKADKALEDHAFGKADDQGAVVRLSLWNHPGDGIYGMFARCRSPGDIVFFDANPCTAAIKITRRTLAGR
jgi:hypothetical protein